MDRERLNTLLTEPTKVEASDVAGLRELAGRYPWFSGAQVLLTVGEAASGGLLYDEHLRTAAAHLPSRARVYDLVHADAGPAPRRRSTPVDAGPLAVPMPLDPPLPHPAQAPPAPSAVGPRAAKLDEARTAPEERSTGTPSADRGADVIAPIPPADADAPSPAPVPGDALDVLIRTEVLAGAYDITRSSSPVAPEAVPQAPPAPAQAADPGTGVPSAPEKEAPPSPPTMPVHAGRRRFTAWLEQDTGPQEAAVAPPTGPGLPPPRTEAAPAAQPAAPGAADIRALIDRFIQGQAPAPAHKAEFFTPQQAAKRSLEEHAELVTETLARIYEQQGDVARAAAAYRRLAERHPQRKEEFLGRARALERGKA